MHLLYDFAIQFYVFAIRLASLFSDKAKLWLNGRKEVFQKLEAAKFQYAKNVIWMHAASLGEFEQGRPIIEQLHIKYPDSKILLTFFSPSGYEIQKDYALADLVIYLPIDTKHNAKRFLELANPTLAIFIKNELWYHYLNELQKAKIPTLLVAALFRENQFFFKPYGHWFKKALQGIDHIFVQNKAAENVLRQNRMTKVSNSGDPRVDRVAQIAADKKPFPIIEAFTRSQPTLICGSTWPPDEEVLKHFINSAPKKWRYLIAPHDISPARISYIENLFQVPSIRYSQAEGAILEDFELMIIDNIGMLSSLYQHGTIAYIGGAFGKGLHNTLEPIAFGLPVIFGPRFQNFEEANYLVKNGGGFAIRSAGDFEKIIRKLEDQSFYQASVEMAEGYIQQNCGATEQVISFIEENERVRGLEG